MLPESFLAEILQKHQTSRPFPATSEIKKLFTKIVLTLFPEQTRVHIKSQEELKAVWESVENGLESMLYAMKADLKESPQVIAAAFMEKVPSIYQVLLTDVEAMVNGDPAATTDYEVIRTYPGFYALEIGRAHV